MTDRETTASAIARELGAELHGPDLIVKGIVPLSQPRAGALTFATDPASAADLYESALAEGAVVLVPAAGASGGTSIVVENPRAAFAAAVRAFFAPVVLPGVHPTAVVDPSASVALSAHIGAFTVLGPGVVVGERVEIRHHVVIAADVVIGDDCVIKSHAVIGEEGLGVDTDPDGNNIRIPHLGSVVLEHHVEVGSFSTVCAGTIVPTRIGAHTKVDDHVHVAHNVQIGRNAMLVGNAELAGSVRVGDRGWIGPNASVLNGTAIGADAIVGIGAVVTRPVPEGETWFGNPARRVPPPAP